MKPLNIKYTVTQAEIEREWTGERRAPEAQTTQDLLAARVVTRKDRFAILVACVFVACAAFAHVVMCVVDVLPA